jgi:simple sugar transport system ATP-binding protein
MNAVEMHGIVKRFGALAANDGIDLSVDAGEVVALLGENGAGKSTLVKILYGLYQPDAGEIRVDGKPVAFRSPADAIASSIGMVTQHYALVPTLTVAENIVLGVSQGVNFNRARAEAAVSETARRYGLAIQPPALVRDLSVGEQQRIEILKALHRQARVLILDEPTAVLTPQESKALFAELKQLVAQGLAIIFISHKLDEVLAVADRVMVLRDGRVVGSANAREADASMLAEMMVGRASFGVNRKDLVGLGGAALEREHSADPRGLSNILELHEVHALNSRGLPALRGVSLDVRAGEVLGVAGVSGNGQTELAEVITGMRRITHGAIMLDGGSIANLSAAQAAEAGIGRIPEDRKIGVVGEMTVAENLALEHLREFTRNGALDKNKMRAHAGQLIAEYNIKAAPTSQAGKLSGGNMQKVILARVLSRNPRIVVAAQPTRGLDIGATDYVRTKLLEQRARGAGVLLISEDLDEILALSDRIAVMFEGRVVGVAPAIEATAEIIGMMMAGKSPTPTAIDERV